MRNMLLLVVSVLLLTVFCSAKEYHYVSIDKLIEQEVGRIILPEVYKKLGITIKITPMPGKRAQQQATSGAKDGEIMRIYTYGENNPTTLRVPTPYYQLETMAFVKKGSGIVLNDKKDLSKYKLVKVSGVKHTDNIAKGIAGVHDIRNTESMMKFLKSGRADIALTNTVDGNLMLKNLGITDIVSAGKPLAVLDLYHYIHEKNKDLIPRVDAVIVEMKKSGELKKIIKKRKLRLLQSSVQRKSRHS